MRNGHILYASTNDVTEEQRNIARKEQLLRELGQDLAHAVSTGEMTELEANEWLVRKRAMRPKSWIVLAWTTIESEYVGVYGLRTGSYPDTANWRAVTVPRAAIWKRSGSPVDVEKAKKFAAEQDSPHSVFVYGPEEKEPLKRARRDLMPTKAT